MFDKFLYDQKYYDAVSAIDVVLIVSDGIDLIEYLFLQSNFDKQFTGLLSLTDDTLKDINLLESDHINITEYLIQWSILNRQCTDLLNLTENISKDLNLLKVDIFDLVECVIQYFGKQFIDIFVLTEAFLKNVSIKKTDDIVSTDLIDKRWITLLSFFEDLELNDTSSKTQSFRMFEDLFLLENIIKNIMKITDINLPFSEGLSVVTDTFKNFTEEEILLDIYTDQKNIQRSFDENIYLISMLNLQPKLILSEFCILLDMLKSMLLLAAPWTAELTTKTDKTRLSTRQNVVRLFSR